MYRISRNCQSIAIPIPVAIAPDDEGSCEVRLDVGNAVVDHVTDAYASERKEQPCQCAGMFPERPNAGECKWHCNVRQQERPKHPKLLAC